MNIYMFSESANLLCRVETSGYFVMNGVWRMTKLQSDSIKDWVEVEPAKWSREKQQQWYFKS